jgi:beta-lactamase regulating signal transducer with metallopeptidase domain
MARAFLTILNLSLTGGYVILAVMLARLLLKRAPKVISYLLWAVAGFRLTAPISFTSALSLLPFNPAPVPVNIGLQAQPHLASGIKVIDQTISRVLPAAVPAASANPLQLFISVGACLWLAGAGVMAAYGVVTFVLLRRRLKGAAPAGGNVYEAENLKTPLVLGFIRPRIYLPRGLTGEERNYILAHERAHLRRGDHLVKAFAYLVLCLHWFNPLAWVAFAHERRYGNGLRRAGVAGTGGRNQARVLPVLGAYLRRAAGHRRLSLGLQRRRLEGQG